MIHPIRRVSLLLTFLLVSGCASATVRGSSPCHCMRPQALVVVADGAGDFRGASNTMRDTARDTCLPVCVESFVWSHGYGRVLLDHTDQEYTRAQGQRLAEWVLARRQQYPELPIHLVGHSAGSGVVLRAVELLPPNAVERIIFLSPAVSSNHDLKAALIVARRGVDVFYSEADWLYLGLGVSVFGTSDRQWDSAAGRVGFRPVIYCPEDAPLYEKLRQYPWHAYLHWTGNHGGHYGAYQPGFLKAYVLPLLAASGEPHK